MNKSSIIFIVILLLGSNLFAQNLQFEVSNSSVNSKFAELGVTYLNNNAVIFASSKKTKNDASFNMNRRPHNRQLFLDLYIGSINKNGDIVNTTKFSDEINNKFFESDIAFSPDFKTIYFTWNNYYDNRKVQDSARWKPLYMFKASISSEFKLTNITPLTFNSKNYSVRCPKVSKDGKKLYFSSDMPNGYGGFDIYEAPIYKNGSVGIPHNMGPNINTKYNDLYPYTDINNNLYFSSYGHKSYGRLDIFKSKLVNGKYQKSENLPKPINSKYDDFAFIIDENNSTGYFTSNRKYGKGDVDIYSFKLKQKNSKN